MNVLHKMKAFAILLCVYMVTSVVSSLPIISKPLENNPDHLVWEALLTIDTHRSDDKTRKIPKSIFITPNLNESKGNCPPDHKLGPDGRCYKTLKIDPLVILKTQIESLLKKNRTATTEYDEDYDYSEYGESTESMNSNGQYTIPLSLGFSNDHRPIHLQQQQQQHEQRLQQQQQQQQSYTTYPSLNRVVKDDAHITPNLHVSSEKENQPFLVSTTGLDLGSEDDNAADAVAESKLETSSSAVATAPSMVPSATRETINTVETEPGSSTSGLAVFDDDSSASTNPTATTFTNADSTTVHGLPPQTTIVPADAEEEISSTDDRLTANTSTSSKVKALPSESDDALESTTAMDEKIALTTDQDHTMATSTDPIENSTDTTVSSTNGYSNASPNKRHTAETLPMSDGTAAAGIAEEAAATATTTIPTDESDSTTTSAQTDEQIHITQSDEDINAQGTTNQPTDAIEPKQQKQNESTNQLPTLSQTGGKLIELDNKDNDDDDDDDVQATSAVPSSSSTTTTTPTNVPFIDSLTATKTEANESNDDLIDAIFIPSQFDTLIDEMDPAVGKAFNDSADEPTKFRLENLSTSAMVDAELGEAEIAPIIDTGKSPRANIELIDNLDESAAAHAHIDSDENDETKNLSARLADELLFLGLKKEDQVAPTALPLSSPPQSATSNTGMGAAVNEKGSLLEETLNGAPVLGIASNSYATTEEPIDYDASEVKMDRKGAGDEGDVAPRKNADYDIISSGNGAIPQSAAEKQTVEPPPTPVQQQQQKKPSIYSTFMNRLKYAPPIVDLSVDHNRPESTIGAVQYSHNPFDLASVIQSSTNERSTGSVAASSQPISPIDDRPVPATLIDGSAAVTHDDNAAAIQSADIIDLSSGGRGNTNRNRHQLQIGINCYLRNLGNKQQFIICDNA